MRTKWIMLLLCSALLFRPSWAQLPQGIDTVCLKAGGHALASATSEDYSDLAFLKRILKDKKVVLLGESSHGIGEYYSLKSRLVKFLHAECGFEVLAIESGIGDVYLEYRKADTISALALRNNTVFGNFQCAEINPLFEYIKATAAGPDPLRYCGFDSQNFGASLNLVWELLRQYAPLEADSVMNAVGKYYQIPSLLWQPDRAPLFRLADTIQTAVSFALNAVQTNRGAIQAERRLTDTDFAFVERALINLRESVSLDWNTEDPSARRDSLMADNLFWLMQKIYPGKKMIIWAHNGHIGKTSPEGNPFKWMGQYVQETFKDSAFHIGLFAREGETYEWWTKTNKPFFNDQPNDIETLAGLYPITFLDLTPGPNACAWLSAPVHGYEVENGGRIRFLPRKRFDAVVVMRKVGLPAYNR
ncbi:MAG: erythromycin esterase family protein [Haliscomenobacter sp.]|nr:erythromycin esterase family protein [Haliscomenobacter sp.]